VEPVLDRTVAGLLDALADPEPTPGGGAAAALAAAMAAGLLAMSARASRDSWPDAAGIAAQAEALRDRIAPLADRTSAAYAEVVDLLGDPGDEPSERRDFRLGAALARAGEMPLRLADAACDVADLGLLVVERGVPDRRADAAAAVVLAEAAARVAAHLVGMNLASRPGDERVARARRLAESAGQAARRALEGGTY
jgi:formiminotetrahydrofolate cyclodeaminase